MSKETSPTWPDPTDWARRLHERLEVIGADYQSASWDPASDPDDFDGLNLKQARAAEALLATCNALRELPIFEKSKGAAILHDVAGALADVVLGGTPRLFVAARPGKPGSDGMFRRYLRVHVVAAVRLLVEAHNFTPGRAQKAVASIYAAAGATGRTGAPLSPTTVKDWCDRVHPLAQKREDARAHEEVEEQLEIFRSDPRWPGNLDDALAFIERVARDPLLSSKYG